MVWSAVHGGTLPNNKRPNSLVFGERDGIHGQYTKRSRLDTGRQICFFSNARSSISHPESSVDVTREKHYGSHEDGRRMNR